MECGALENCVGSDAQVFWYFRCIASSRTSCPSRDDSMETFTSKTCEVGQYRQATIKIVDVLEQRAGLGCCVYKACIIVTSMPYRVINHPANPYR